jgi:hypothetical protein
MEAFEIIRKLTKQYPNPNLLKISLETALEKIKITPDVLPPNEFDSLNAAREYVFTNVPETGYTSFLQQSSKNPLGNLFIPLMALYYNFLYCLNETPNFKWSPILFLDTLSLSTISKDVAQDLIGFIFSKKFSLFCVSSTIITKRSTLIDKRVHYFLGIIRYSKFDLSSLLYYDPILKFLFGPNFLELNLPFKFQNQITLKLIPGFNLYFDNALLKPFSIYENRISFSNGPPLQLVMFHEYNLDSNLVSEEGSFFFEAAISACRNQISSHPSKIVPDDISFGEILAISKEHPDIFCPSPNLRNTLIKSPRSKLEKFSPELQMEIKTIRQMIAYSRLNHIQPLDGFFLFDNNCYLIANYKLSNYDTIMNIIPDLRQNNSPLYHWHLLRYGLSLIKATYN